MNKNNLVCIIILSIYVLLLDICVLQHKHDNMRHNNIELKSDMNVNNAIHLNYNF